MHFNAPYAADGATALPSALPRFVRDAFEARSAGSGGPSRRTGTSTPPPSTRPSSASRSETHSTHHQPLSYVLTSGSRIPSMRPPLCNVLTIDRSCAT